MDSPQQSYALIELLSQAGYFHDTDSVLMDLNDSGLRNDQIRDKLEAVTALYNMAKPNVAGCPVLPDLIKMFTEITDRSGWQ